MRMFVTWACWVSILGLVVGIASGFLPDDEDGLAVRVMKCEMENTVPYASLYSRVYIHDVCAKVLAKHAHYAVNTPLPLIRKKTDQRP